MAAYGVYSTRFIAGIVNSSGTAAAASYTVPVGKVAVVRAVDIFHDFAGLMFFGLFNPGNSILIVSTKDSPVHHVTHFDGRQVFNPGDIMGCQYGDGQHRIMVSGYLLSSS